MFLIENAPNRLDDEILSEEVFVQFLNSDVVDSSNPVIPASVIQQKEPFTLNGTFVLQMNYIIDICKFVILAILLY